MYSFPNLESVCCTISGSNCCFLTCIQISQEAGQVVWYSHLLKNFPQFVVIHTVSGSSVNESEVDFIWNSLAFSMIQQMLAIWSLVPLPFLNPAWTSRSSHFIYYWSLVWRSLSIFCQHVRWVQLCGSLNMLWDWNENWPFPVLWPLLSFPNLLAYWVQHFHSIIF